MSPDVHIREITTDEVAARPDLMQAHWDDICRIKQWPCAPDVPRFEALACAGVLLMLGVFVQGELVGYSVNIFGRHLHYDFALMQNDALFLLPEHRQGRAGLRLLRETERRAKDWGAVYMVWHAKPDTALDAMLPKMGYGVQDILYSKEL